MTRAVIDRSLAYLRSPQYQIDRNRQEEEAYQLRKAIGRQIEAQYCQRMGIAELTEEQRQELWSKMSERYIVAMGMEDWF